VQLAATTAWSGNIPEGLLSIADSACELFRLLVKLPLEGVAESTLEGYKCLWHGITVADATAAEPAE
jgi:hypothetical protein